MTALMMGIPNDDPQNDICAVCKNRRWWHRENSLINHEFSEDGQLRTKGVEAAPPAPPAGGADLPLRAALIRAGLLHPDDLTEAEGWIKAAAAGGMALVVTADGYDLKPHSVVAREAANAPTE